MPYLGYVIFIATGITVFFLGAFLVVLLRTKNPSKIIMPDLIGKNYIEVHNELMRLRMKVKIDNKRFPDKNDGEILYQSITPGKSVEEGSKIYLTVNTGIDRVKVPDLKGQALSNAKSILEKLLSGETYVNLQIGGITYVKAEPGQSPDTVIDQIPEAGKDITTREKVYLLVTEEKSATEVNPESWKNLPLPLVTEELNQRGLPWKVREIIASKFRHENGLVESAVKNPEGVFEIKVRYYPVLRRAESGYEKISYKPDSSQKYKITLEKISGEGRKPVLLQKDTSYKENEDLNLVFYRTGDVRVSILRENGDAEKSFKFESEL